MSLYLDPSDEYKMKAKNSQFQYQEDPEGERPIFRYDYLRTPTTHSRGSYPGSHLHIYGDLTEAGCLPSHTPLGRIHFPTRRISLEAIIRLLAFDFEIHCNTDHAFWQAVLGESERLFREIAHEST
jgi:hypothetical protein